MKKSINPEDLGLVNINETGLSFYIIASNYGGNPDYSLDKLKMHYDISFTYANTTNGLDTLDIWDKKRIEVRECIQDDFGWE